MALSLNRLNNLNGLISEPSINSNCEKDKNETCKYEIRFTLLYIFFIF